MKFRNTGFSLVELAITMVILGLLFGTIIIPVSETFKNTQYKANYDKLEKAKEALIGFAIKYQRLPCPALAWIDTTTPDNEGEDACSPDGSSYNTSGIVRGFIPWKTLGIPRIDSWGNGIFYVVEQRLTNKDEFLELISNNESLEAIRVQGRDNSDLSKEIKLGDSIALVIGSFGRKNINFNHSSGTLFGTLTGAVSIPSSIISDERDHIANCCETMPSSQVDSSTPSNFWSRIQYDQDHATYGTFDDQIVWIPWFQLVGIMTQAGRTQ